MAMLDAMELGLAIVRHRDDQSKAIEEYEEKMYAYSSKGAQMSDHGLKICFSDGAAAKLTNFMKSLHDTIKL